MYAYKVIHVGSPEYLQFAHHNGSFDVKNIKTRLHLVTCTIQNHEKMIIIKEYCSIQAVN